jgi:hypothetical protein
MKHAHYDQTTGDVIGFYSDDIHDVIPQPSVELTDEEWGNLLGRHLRYINGAFEDIPAQPASYADQRREEYPSFADQFDLLYHGGYDAWKAAIQVIKDKYPK